ncbi:helix-turn-helix domain-containing protein [Streptomyces sp. KR80]|uniref:helix-turn-helix domain-containing protein n=1 Tax=Streptomyces sp. KR80 TaxID=3457426 RepID=UPI003FD2FD98
MLEQPSFGRRLKHLRVQRGLSQAVLAGDGMSTGYLSRLESGARQPTERAVAYLANQLGVTPADFEEPQAQSLAQALAVATSAQTDDTVLALLDALAADRQDQDPALRWQALWLLAQLKRQHGERDAELSYLTELVELGEDLALPELCTRARTQLARCLRSTGDIAQATQIAAAAYATARDSGLSVPDTASALLALVSVEAEAGRLPDARAHVDELCTLTKGESGVLPVEALWTAAIVRLRQGDQTEARELLEAALELMDSRADLMLWMRLRLAAASLYLQLTTPSTEDARIRLDEAQTALQLIGNPLHLQEMTTLQAQLAFLEGRYKEARALYDSLDGADLRLTFRDQIRLTVLHNRLLVLEGRADEGIRNLQALAQQAQDASNIDLAAEIWRILAQTLAEGR